jgi:hypothetical protein
MSLPPQLAEKSSAKPSSLLGDLGPRLVSAVAMIALALGALVQGGFVFVAFWTYRQSKTTIESLKKKDADNKTEIANLKHNLQKSMGSRYKDLPIG